MVRKWLLDALGGAACIGGTSVKIIHRHADANTCTDKREGRFNAPRLPLAGRQDDGKTAEEKLLKELLKTNETLLSARDCRAANRVYGSDG